MGLGYRTGLSAANFLATEGHEVHVSDIKTRDELSEVISQLDSEITVHAANQEIALLDHTFDIIVLSPGVPATVDWGRTCGWSSFGVRTVQSFMYPVGSVPSLR